MLWCIIHTMNEDRQESMSLIISLLLCLGVILAAVLMNYVLLKKPDFYIDLRQYPMYGRIGFETDSPAGAESAPPWNIIAPAGDIQQIMVTEKFGVRETPFLYPFGHSPEEFTVRINFEMPEKTVRELEEEQTIIPGIFLAAIGDNWEVYLNGTLIRSEVHLDDEGEITSHRAQRKVR